MADMVKIRARGADPATLVDAQQRLNAMAVRIDSAAAEKLGARAIAANSKQAKVLLLRQLGDVVTAAAKGIAPCSKGCNHCCKMATLVSVEEAEVIARETGARLTMPTQFNQFGDAMRDKHTGVACTFLTEQGCSIYAQRPFACRIHVSLDADDMLCEIVPGVTIRSPNFNTAGYDMMFVKAFGGPLAMRYADIRDFFVPRTGRKE